MYIFVKMYHAKYLKSVHFNVWKLYCNNIFNNNLRSICLCKFLGSLIEILTQWVCAENHFSASLTRVQGWSLYMRWKYWSAIILYVQKCWSYFVTTNDLTISYKNVLSLKSSLFKENVLTYFCKIWRFTCFLQTRKRKLLSSLSFVHTTTIPVLASANALFPTKKLWPSLSVWLVFSLFESPMTRSPF